MRAKLKALYHPDSGAAGRVLRVTQAFASSAGLCLLSILPAPAPLRAQAVPPKLGNVLAKTAHFEETDFKDLAASRPVARVLETHRGNEIAIAGAIRIRVPREFYLNCVRDIVRLKKGSFVPEIGKFSTPPLIADLGELHLEPRDLEALRDCNVGDCRLKLPAAIVAQFQARDFRAGDKKTADEAANVLFRRFLLERVEAYLASGDSALGDYSDKNKPVSPAAEDRELLAESDVLGANAPRLGDCLRRFPACQGDPEIFYYWSKEQYEHRLRPVVSMTQVLIDKNGADGDGWIWQASKQLYADHYSNGSLGLSVMVEAEPVEAVPSFYLIYLNRTRSDSLGSFWGFLFRATCAAGPGTR